MEKSRQQYARYGNQNQRSRMNTRYGNRHGYVDRCEERNHEECGCEKNMCNNECTDARNFEYRVGQGPFGGPGPMVDDHNCCPGTGRDELAGMPLAMAYVPWQNYCNLNDDCEALYLGNLFKDLDKDFYGRRC